MIRSVIQHFLNMLGDCPDRELLVDQWWNETEAQETRWNS